MEYEGYSDRPRLRDHERDDFTPVSGVAIVISIAAAIFLVSLPLIRGLLGSKYYHTTPRLVLTKFHISPNNPLALVQLIGRRAGIIGWVLHTIGNWNTYEIHIGERLATIKSPSIFSEHHIVIPVHKIRAATASFFLDKFYIVTGLLTGCVLLPVLGSGSIAIGLTFGIAACLFNSGTRLAITTGEGFWGYQYATHTSTKEITFRALEQIRLLLLRVQEGVAFPHPQVGVSASGPAIGEPYAPLPQPHAPLPALEPPPWLPHGSTPLPVQQRSPSQQEPAPGGAAAMTSAAHALDDPSAADTLLGVATQGLPDTRAR